jgi:hypothetical protein
MINPMIFGAVGGVDHSFHSFGCQWAYVAGDDNLRKNHVVTRDGQPRAVRLVSFFVSPWFHRMLVIQTES